jgi:septal ring factor EnvC (AmiA/AmiB activator)
MAHANDPVITKSMLDEALRESSKSIIDEIAGIVSDFSTRVDERFNKVEAGLHRVETRLDAVEASIADLNTKYDRLVTTLDRFLKRLDDKDQEDAARDAHLERLDRWVHQVAERLQMELR